MMAQMSRGRLDLLRPLTAGCLAAANAQLHPAALSSGGSSSRVLRLHRAGSGHSGMRSACRLPSEACRSHRLLPDVRAALREVCRSLRGALRAPLGAAASRSAGGGRAVPRVRPAPGRFCPPSLPFVQERTPGRVGVSVILHLLWTSCKDARFFIHSRLGIFIHVLAHIIELVTDNS